jgi:hypothetical protein
MRIALVAAFVVIGMMIGTAFYVSRYGGTNKPPMKPLHSQRVEPQGREIV